MKKTYTITVQTEGNTEEGMDSAIKSWCRIKNSSLNSIDNVLITKFEAFAGIQKLSENFTFKTSV